MTTPVVQFIDQYRHSGTLRLHMPGHKGQGEMEALDITEIQGADPLYPAAGILREGEENAALLFGAGRTLYSAEGSSLCIRAMLYLARLRAEQNQIPPRILAGRNAHRTFLAGAAVLGLEVAWIPGENLLTCLPSTQELRQALAALPQPPAAVYLTSPDYLGHRADIASLAAVCHAQGVPLLVDNAHGAYLRFLPQDQHPLSLGADLVCDSGHKTLPVLTGGAYLHIHREAEPLFFQQAERALALFASTSPSWLILRSLDACNGYLAGDYPQELARFSAQVDKVKDAMQAHGYALIGEEPLKITIAPKSFGYTGDQLHDCLRGADMECEFSDPDFLVMNRPLWAGKVTACADAASPEGCNSPGTPCAAPLLPCGALGPGIVGPGGRGASGEELRSNPGGSLRQLSPSGADSGQRGKNYGRCYSVF